MTSLLGIGAEGRVTRVDDYVIKSRENKSYRHPVLDERIRQFRTRREAKVLSRLDKHTPKLLSVDDTKMTISMSFLDARALKEVICEDNAARIGQQIGEVVLYMHQQGVCHGDLTTSNLLVSDTKEVFVIDFGLAFFSTRLEDFAVDLHLLKQSLLASHPTLNIFSHAISTYAPSKELQQQFKVVESRGRYKKH